MKYGQLFVGSPPSTIALSLSILPTLVDRFALYLLPIQLYIGSRIPYARILGISGRDEYLLYSYASFISIYEARK